MKKASSYLNPNENSKRKSISPSKREVEKKKAETDFILDNLRKEGVQTDRPKTRSECPSYRPCPFVSCRYNLYLDITRTGSIKYNFYPLELWEIKNTCALDVADESPEGMPLTEIGDMMGLTRERIRQIEMEALGKLRETIGEEKLKSWMKSIDWSAL